MAKYIGNTNNIIDWNLVIENCKDKSVGDHNTVTSVVDRSEAEASSDQLLLGYYRDVIGTWEKAGYDLKEIEWWDYYPGQHFPIEVQTAFGEFVNAKPLRVFVSVVYPGITVPYHWDVEDKEKEWLEEFGDLVRYVCFIDEPQVGNIFLFKEQAFYKEKQGNVYEWDNYRMHHAAAVAGFEPQYLFHFLGYRC